MRVRSSRIGANEVSKRNEIRIPGRRDPILFVIPVVSFVMSITILTASDVDKLISDPATVEQAIASQRDILTAFSALATSHDKDAHSQAIQIPPRISVVSDDVTALCMPSRVKVLERNDAMGTGIGVKVVSVPHQGGAGLPATTTLFDGRTGQLRAVVNARNLTALRNACGEPCSLPSSDEQPKLFSF